jgi:hypothetical protein
MSDTPRTDAAYFKPHATMYDLALIECELNVANERIKRLEEALESIREYWNRDNNERAMEDACWHAINTASEALEAKEAKP